MSQQDASSLKDGVQPIQSWTGGCFCGRIRYRIGSRPLGTRLCWCRDCRYLATGNASVSVFFKCVGLTVTGSPAEYVRQAASGARIKHSFCATCGTPLFASDLADATVMVVRAGSLYNQKFERPEGTIWADSAPDWAHLEVTPKVWPRQQGE